MRDGGDTQARRWWAVGAAAGAALALGAARQGAGGPGPPDSAPAVEFNRDIRPILAANCFKCHGPDSKARQEGLRLDTREGARAMRRDGRAAVVPGDPDASLLLARVRHADPERRMPPPEASKEGLSPRQIDLLRRWIGAGAPWEEHWSFASPRRRGAPGVSDATWCRGEIDRWVLARLDAEGLSPSPEAPRATLLRRVSLDLVGLPPTPAEVEAFERDAAPDAYERAVDRLLASPRFGEKWARWWLDLARYADTKGYEKDERRTMWPYRDWVIRALNADVPFDRFAFEQLAGDLPPEAGRESIIATAFHRNTMTNDEGGTDDEEFRVAAVVDRVNTTSEVFLGLTMACVQCHAHKYDPFEHADYYRLFALFNNTEDADRPDEAPTLALLTGEQERRIDELAKEIEATEGLLRAALAAAEAPPPPPAAGAGVERDYLWLDDALPAGAAPRVENTTPAWNWVEAPALAPARGARSFGGGVARGQGQQFFIDAHPPLPVREGDRLFAHVLLDAAHPPRQVMLQFHSTTGGWEHRAYWGESLIRYGGQEGQPSLLRVGDLPAPGRWARLEVDGAGVGLVGREIDGWAFSLFEGTAHWDAAGVRTAHEIDEAHLWSLERWAEVARGRGGAGLPAEVAAAVESGPALWDQPGREAARRHWLRHVHPPTAAAVVPLESRLAAARAEIERVRAAGLALPVMRELRGERRRVTRRLERGSYLSPAEEVPPGVPAVLAGVAGAPPGDRLELARWLFHENNPLTGRVLANRVWEQVFGAGIVETVEDFGVQGSPPTHPELLDHLAVSFRESGWSLKHLLRAIVVSSTYRQDSRVRPELLDRDPYNRLLARGPRFRLDGETIRDQALAASGLLSAKMFGPPVFPPQPEGLWIMIYSGDRWVTSTGEDRYRRGLYTFWRRTVPHPAMTTFDAPSREFCVSRRIRTNTPLQAFVTLNDPAFVECAQAMARRVVSEGAGDGARAAHAFRLAVARRPEPEEVGALLRLLADERARFAADPGAAERAACDPLGPLPPGADAAELAAWSVVCGVALNLDEALTKE